MRSILLAVLVSACSSRSGQAPGDGPGADSSGDGSQGGTIDAPPPLATGTVTSVTYQKTCAVASQPVGGGAEPAFQCAVLTVACPGIDPADVDVALTPGTGDKGVIVTHSGSEGTLFETIAIPQGMLQKGWALAQIAWHLPWECPKHGATDCAMDTTSLASRAGMVEAACRPATVIQWIHDHALAADGTTPFVAAGKPYCGYGFSGGSGAFWYALTHYGASQQLDYVVLGASSPFAKIDAGCDSMNEGKTVAAACDTGGPQVGYTFDTNDAGAQSAFNKWLSTTGCDHSPSSDELALYARSGVVSPGANFDFPTPVTTYDCVDIANNTLNVVPGGGRFVLDQLRAVDPSGSRFKANCVVTPGGGSCTGEQVFQDTMTRQNAVNDLDAHCTPLAR